MDGYLSKHLVFVTSFVPLHALNNGFMHQKQPENSQSGLAINMNLTFVDLFGDAHF